MISPAGARPPSPPPPSPGSRGTSFIVTRPVAILMLFLAAVVFGALSMGRLPLTLMPELTYPTLTVRTEYPGAAPEEVENDISRPVEEALGVIGGLERVSSISRAGISDVVLEFTWDVDIAEATQDVLEKLDLVFLPEEAERPLILHFDPSLDPVMELSLAGDGPRFDGEAGLRRLRRLAELRIRKELEPIKGVAAVRVRGGLEEEIHVLLEEEKLRQTGLSIQRVIDRLAQENINVAGGTLQEGRTEYLVRTLNEYASLDEIAETIVAESAGRHLRVRDLGSVEWAHREREIETHTDGAPSVQIEIYKEGDANIVALAHRVKELVGELAPPGGQAATTAAAGGPARGGPPGAQPPATLAAAVWREEGARLELVADRSLFIESSIREVRTTAIMGGLLAIFVLYLFLRSFKSTAIVAVSIPISLLVAFAPLNLLGVSLNIMSLGGLALGVGMLVDSSIVVLESIFRCRTEGDGIVAAAERGTHEVSGAVWASTLTSIAVFFPMVFVEGIAGQAFGDLGLAVVVSLLASTGVALYFIPMLASRRGVAAAGDAAAGERPRRWPRLGFEAWRAVRESFRGWRRLLRRPRFARAWLAPLAVLLWPAKLVLALLAALYLIVRFVVACVLEATGKLLQLVVVLLALLVLRLVWPGLGFLLGRLLWLPAKLADLLLRALNRGYPRVIRAALAHPGLVVLFVVGCLWGTWLVARGLSSELLPEVHQGEFTVKVTLPVGTPLEETASVVAPIERAILAEREQIDSLIVTMGYDSTDSQESDEGEHTAEFKVLLEASRDVAATEREVIARLREAFGGIPDLDVRIERPVLFSFKTPIEVEIHGDDLGRLRAQADRAAAIMSGMTELADVETSLRRGAPEVQIVYDRDRLQRYGLDIAQVADLVRNKVKGYEATRFNLRDRRVPIMVRLALDDRETVEDVRSTIINPGGERPISLASVAGVSLGEGPSEVRRIDGRRVAVIGANLAEGSLSQATWRIRDELGRRIDWPSDMTFLISGQNEEWEQSRASLWIALGLSVFLVYVIMAAQFESLVHPLTIMLTIPLAFVGTVLALKLGGLNLSIVVFLGMIMLAGIVVNNAIVLVDYVNTLRGRGMARDEAVVTAGAVRLRPILMTTATTVLGLLPMAAGLGDGAEIRTPMAVAVISGLISSTALTLVIIPVFYVLADEAKTRLFGRRRMTQAAGGEPGLAGAGGDPVTP